MQQNCWLKGLGHKIELQFSSKMNSSRSNEEPLLVFFNFEVVSLMIYCICLFHIGEMFLMGDFFKITFNTLQEYFKMSSNILH
jgi:hypothetical protein